MPSTWARRHVVAHVGVGEVELRLGDAAVVRRRIPKGTSDIDYAAHYLAVLSTKPQAVRQVADTLVAQLGPPFPELWARLVEDNGPRDAARRMARILQGVVELGRDECVRRVERALRDGEAIATALLVACPTVAPTTAVPALLDVTVESSSVAVFDELLAAGGAQ